MNKFLYFFFPQLIQSDVKGQEKAARKLNKAVDDLVTEQGQEIPEIKDTQDEMNEMLRRVQADSKDKEAKMQEKLRQVCLVTNTTF